MAGAMKPGAKIAIGLGVAGAVGGLWWFLARKSRARAGTATRLTPAGLAFIAGREGYSLAPYPDAGHCSIGIGHLLHEGPCTRADAAMTHMEVLALFARDIQRFVDGVLRVVKVPLAPHELDALVSFAFNIGLEAFAGSTLVRRLNAGDRAAVPAEMMKWTRVGEVRDVPGKVERRTLEGRIFTQGIYPA